MIVPQALRKRVVSLTYKRRQRVKKTKDKGVKKTSKKVWWPGMDRDADRRYSECSGCQLVTKSVPPSSLKQTMLSKQPCEELAVDLMCHYRLENTC